MMNKTMQKGGKMPSQHIKDKTWRKVQDATVKAVIDTQKNIKTKDILDLAISIGLKNIEPEDLEALARDK